ncbi:MAG: Rieske 2Fe-2S domain-containing protein [Anaerolineales bacterium]|nr:Rieske 2Fe-2S domain-containing protein [Anaerolineales bacterium]
MTQEQEKTLNRRDALKVLWTAAGALAVGELAFVGYKFLSPRKTDGEFGGIFNLGQITDYPNGSVTPIEAGRFYLVRLEDGGLLALYRKCTHLGCAVPYEPTLGQFVCPCHGSAFDLDGDVQNAPAPRALDLFELTIQDGNILVNTGKVIERQQTSPANIVNI